jgi:membrane protein CcdC involved in cytochrome C biogenesis
MTRKDEKRTKGREKDKGFIFIDLSLKGQKRQKKQKKTRVPPLGFIPVGNILVFSPFFKVNKKSSF